MYDISICYMCMYKRMLYVSLVYVMGMCIGRSMSVVSVVYVVS